MYKPKHFSTYELVDRQTYELLGGNAIKLFNEGLLKDLDNLREHFDKQITVNDWNWGGVLTQRGFRTSLSETGGKTSQHRKGNAIDFDVEGKTAQQVRDYIVENKDLYPSINRMESNVGWVHIDCHPDYKDKRIYLFSP